MKSVKVNTRNTTAPQLPVENTVSCFQKHFPASGNYILVSGSDTMTQQYQQMDSFDHYEYLCHKIFTSEIAFKANPTRWHEIISFPPSKIFAEKTTFHVRRKKTRGKVLRFHKRTIFFLLPQLRKLKNTSPLCNVNK